MKKPAFPYRVTLSSAENTILERAAAKVGISPQRYLSAVFADLVPAKIGKVKIQVKGDARDGMGLLVGPVQIARESKAIAQDLATGQIARPRTDVAAENNNQPTKLSKPCQRLFDHLCLISKGKKIRVRQVDLVAETRLTQPKISAHLRDLVSLGLIYYSGKRGQPSWMIAPFGEDG